MFIQHRIVEDLTLIPSMVRYLIQVKTSPTSEWRVIHQNLSLQAAKAIRDNNWQAVKPV